FYVLRGRIHWLDRFPSLGKYRDVVSDRVRAHETGMVLASRFLPGLRTAIPIACAYAGVRPLKFSALNLVSAFGWASLIMLLVRGGSMTLTAFGLHTWWGPFVPAAMLVVFIRWLAKAPRKNGARPLRWRLATDRSGIIAQRAVVAGAAGAVTSLNACRDLNFQTPASRTSVSSYRPANWIPGPRAALTKVHRDDAVALPPFTSILKFAMIW